MSWYVGIVLGLEDLLLAAEAVLEIDARILGRAINTNLAHSALAAPFASFGGQHFYEQPLQRAAVLASRIVRNHPLPDGNNRVALLLMDLYLEEQGYCLQATPPEIDRAFRALAGRELSEEGFLTWLEAHTREIER